MYSRIKHYLHDRCDAALVLVVVLLQYDFYFIDYYMKRLAVINIQSTYKCEKLKAEKKQKKKTNGSNKLHVQKCSKYFIMGGKWNAFCVNVTEKQSQSGPHRLLFY